MRLSSRARALVAAAAMATLLLTPAPAHAAEPGTIALVDVALDGTPGDGGVGGADISDDGRYVASASTSSNLVPGDVNGTTDIFVRNIETGTTTLVSGGPDGQPANDWAEYVAAISGTGRYVAFTSYASNLVPGDTNNERDVFVYDRETGVTARANRPATGDELPDGSNPSISTDGTRVTWESYAPYVPADTNGTGDVYVRDLIADTTTLVTADRQGTDAGDSYSSSGRLAAGGRYVAFYSSAADLVARDVNGHLSDVFVRDLKTGRTTAVSTTPAGPTANSDSFDGAASANGSRIVFHSGATDLGVDPGDGHQHLFVRCSRNC